MREVMGSSPVGPTYYGQCFGIGHFFVPDRTGVLFPHPICYNKPMKKIVLTGGGTAGHCIPNLALVPALKNAGFDISYIGSKNGIEQGLVKDAGLPYSGISSGKLRRYFDIKNFTDPFRIMKGFGEAFSILKQTKPDIVFSKGGYVSVPVVRAAAMQRIPVVIHESDMTPGLANKLCFGAAEKVCCSFRETMQYLPRNKAVFTGSPIRSELKEGNRERALAFTSIREGDYPCLMVMGGSLGAQHINEAVRRILPKILPEMNVVHLCGRGKVDPTLNRTKGYVQYDYIENEMADLFAMSDFVISRAGSNAIFELLALHKPNILIPLPSGSSRGDQLLNAESFSRAGYSYLLKEEEMNDESLLAAIAHIKDRKDGYQKKMEEAHESNAVETICTLINDIVQKKGWH